MHFFDERNHYFTGKYMTARDFGDEQRYLISHHQWHQWGLHGWGIVWGLEIELEHDGCTTLHPGVALDCYGRELVIRDRIRFKLDELRGFGKRSQEAAPDDSPFLVGLRFCTRNRELVPLILDDCSDVKEKHNRVQEYARVGFEDFCNECWTPPRSYRPAELPHVKDHQSDPLTLDQYHDPDACNHHRDPDTIWPPCECSEPGFVPLAKIYKKTSNEQSHWKASDLGRRFVHSPFYGEALTHIVGINWDHAKRTELLEMITQEPSDYLYEDARKAFRNRCSGDIGHITITFDRAISLPRDGKEEEIWNSNYWIQLIRLDFCQVGNHDMDGDDPPEVINPVFAHLSQDKRQLLIHFPTEKLESRRAIKLRLALNCDMIVDSRGRAVDGDHLNGKVAKRTEPLSKDELTARDYSRSGNGTEGGLFVSWTRIIHRKRQNSYVGELD